MVLFTNFIIYFLGSIGGRKSSKIEIANGT